MIHILDSIIFWPFVIGAILLMITPGPDMTFFLGKSLVQGRNGGFAAMFGAITGVILHSIAAAFGLSALILNAPTVFMGLKIVGALYLLWLGYQDARYGSSARFETTGAEEKLLSIYGAGILINLLNPKVILFFLAYLPQFVRPELGQVEGQFIGLGILFLVTVVPIAVAMILSTEQLIGYIEKKPHILRYIDYSFAVLMAAFAIQLMLF